MKRLGTISSVTVVLGLTTAAYPAIWYVNAAATGTQDGSNWHNAFLNPQPALAATAPGDEIWVAAGVYTPGPPGDAVSSFVMHEGVALYGGFAGTETARDQRNWITHVTILSGDVGHDDIYGNPWYVGWNIVTANSGHVVVGSGVGPTAVLDGFIVQAGATGPAGTPAGDPLGYGGGLYVIGGSPTIRNCTFTRNLAAFASGGAIYCQDASPTIAHCRFVQNYVHLGNGAGIAIVGSAIPSISDCDFVENHAVADSGNTGQGSGISINFLTAPLSALIEHCRFEYNVARTFFSAGGIEIARGAGISNFGATLTVRDCIFHHNSANAGAGIQSWDPITVVNSLFYANTVYSHDFGAGSDGGYGAGICIYSFQPDVATVVNCTIANNSGGEGVGMQSLGNAAMLVFNSIIWGNVATGEDVAPRDAGIRGSYDAEYACIQDLLTPVPGEDPPDPENYPGCIVANPQLISAADYHLGANSPCIDAGRNSSVPPALTTDLEGRVRFFDDPATPDTGQGVAPVVDMGAYEFALVVAGDIDCDGACDLQDALALTAVLLGQDDAACHVAAADINDDGAEDGLDVQGFVDALLIP